MRGQYLLEEKKSGFEVWIYVEDMHLWICRRVAPIVKWGALRSFDILRLGIDNDISLQNYLPFYTSTLPNLLPSFPPLRPIGSRIPP